MTTLLERAPLDRYRAEAQRYLGGLPEIDLDANLAEAKRNQTAYAGAASPISGQSFVMPGTPCTNQPGTCDCCTLYKPDCDQDQ